MPDFPAFIDLAGLDGSSGFRINGIDPYDRSGFSVSSAGDVNGDGFDDVIIGAYGADSYAGDSYVVFGESGGFAASFDLASLDGSNGFRLDGISADDRSGYSVASAGDVNGDGFADLLIGAWSANLNGDYNTGQSYVVLGKAGGFAAAIDLASLDGSNGFSLDGIEIDDRSGFSVASAGDVNGDGFADLIIGAHRAEPDGRFKAGESYVVFGMPGGFTASLALSSLDGSNGFRLKGIDPSDYSGISVASAGDVNGDGFDDLIIGAHHADANGVFLAGEAYVIFGKAQQLASAIELADLDGSNGYRLTGINPSDRSGFSVSSAGDINGDGFDDLIVGAHYAAPNGNFHAGESYVVFGMAGPVSPSLDLAGLDGSNGFRLNGIDPDDLSGFSVASAGDVNGDGFDDLIIGAREADANDDNYAGESYVVFGSGAGFDAELDLASLDGANGFRLDGIDANDLSGTSVASAGDVNGDGFGDILVGASGADPHGDSNAGESYVVFGRAPTEAVRRVGSDADQVIRGGDFDDTLLGENGDDTLDGGVGADSMMGGAGDDQYFVDDVGDLVVEAGSEGFDTVRTRIDFTLGASEIEAIVAVGATGLALRGGDNATRITGAAGADTLTGGRAGDMLRGEGGNDLIAARAGRDTLDGGEGDDRLKGEGGMDTLMGGDGADTLAGGGSADRLDGGLGDDRLIGSQGRDTMEGGEGNDRLDGGLDKDELIGGAGDDTLVGNEGRDTMTGGAGADRFRFDALEDFSGEAQFADRIMDFSQADGDLIDLRRLDAITGGEDDSFAFIGNAAFSGTAGELRYEAESSTITYVMGDTDGNGEADFTIRLDSSVNLVASDFLL